MLRISLIGPGDVEKHLRIIGMSAKQYNENIKSIAKVLADQNVEIVLLPDRGVSVDIAKLYKQYNGKKVIGMAPLSDKPIEHLKPYINMKVNGKPLFDKIIDTRTWYRQDMTHCLFGDYVLCLGLSLGSLGELMYDFYLYKIMKGIKPGVKTIAETYHKECRAGKNIEFGAIMFKPFMSDLPYEIKDYINMVSKLDYVNNAEELSNIIKSLKNH